MVAGSTYGSYMLTGTAFCHNMIADSTTGSVVWLTTEKLFTEIVIANIYL